jgi:hypothetical protein
VSDPLPATPARARPHITLPDGDILMPRAEFANDVLGVSDRTAQRMNFPTTYIAGIAHVPRNASLKVIADRVTSRNQPRRPRVMDPRR